MAERMVASIDSPCIDIPMMTLFDPNTTLDEIKVLGAYLHAVVTEEPTVEDLAEVTLLSPERVKAALVGLCDGHGYNLGFAS